MLLVEVKLREHGFGSLQSSESHQGLLVELWAELNLGLPIEVQVLLDRRQLEKVACTLANTTIGKAFLRVLLFHDIL